MVLDGNVFLFHRPSGLFKDKQVWPGRFRFFLFFQVFLEAVLKDTGLISGAQHPLLLQIPRELEGCCFPTIYHLIECKVVLSV
jgi:hypothetical protein